jgi:biotin synthase
MIVSVIPDRVFRNDWTVDEVEEIFQRPLLDLVHDAAIVHRQNGSYAEVQVCSLVSIKTGGCPEDCAYCPQSARYHTSVEAEPLMSMEELMEAAVSARSAGATRLCMGAAWREVSDGAAFDRVLEMVGAVSELGMEVCCTLGMLSGGQARRLKDAGLHAYNHNIDTSEEYYKTIISTRTFDDRLRTLENVRAAGITVCSGGILGLGERVEDRIGMLHTLATLPQHPESVPINALVRVAGTPLGNEARVSVWDMVRAIATARILMPRTMVRLSAGRLEMSVPEQALCFMAGANSIFVGDKLLTTPNPSVTDDMEMFRILGLKPRAAFADAPATATTDR